MKNDGNGNVHLEYRIPTRGLIGFRSFFVRTTRGDGVNNSQFIGYEPMTGTVKSTTAGVLVASEGGTAVTYGLLNAQGRGSTFIDPGTTVYEGMIVGMHPKDGDIPINVCREKKLTNMRSSTADVAKRLNPTMKMSLEEALDFISADELVELTPKNYRLRKKELTFGARHKLRR
jgi:GTP-binding protein